VAAAGLGHAAEAVPDFVRRQSKEQGGDSSDRAKAWVNVSDFKPRWKGPPRKAAAAAA